MKKRFRLLCRGKRGSTFYCLDTLTGKRTSLRTKDSDHAEQVVLAKNQALRQPILNLQIAKAYLAGSDPGIATRTWQAAMDESTKTKHGATRSRYEYAMRDKAFDLIRNVPILETQTEQYLRVFDRGTVSTNVYLRRIHNFALDMNWLPWPIIPKRQWPPVRFKDKRAITLEEHELVLQREKNSELRAFYMLLWHLGGSQSDVASLRAEDIDWEQHTIGYSRRKSGSPALIHFGEHVDSLLGSLPRVGPLFPRLAPMHEKHRAKEFKRRCEGLGIEGISLHSYRYAWAERAKVCGYPERFAQQALGHNSKAVHRAYARKAQVLLPSLEEYEREHAKKKVIAVSFNQGRTAANSPIVEAADPEVSCPS